MCVCMCVRVRVCACMMCACVMCACVMCALATVWMSVHRVDLALSGLRLLAGGRFRNSPDIAKFQLLHLVCMYV